MIKRIALLATILILSLYTPVLAAEPGSGTIEGHVVNETQGSSVVNQEITLKTYFNTEELAAATVQTDTEGRFLFDGLPTDTSYTYEIMVIYEIVEYYSDILIFEDGETSIFEEISVYDTTTSDEAIKVMIAFTTMRTDEQGSMWITEYLLVVNDSDLTYIGSMKIPSSEKAITLRFTLPEDATEVRNEYGLMECCIYDSEDGFVDTMPIIPGGKEIQYSYKVNYESGKYTFYRAVNYPTNNYALLVQGQDTRIISDQLSTEEPINLEDGLFALFSSKTLAPDTTLIAHLSNLPGTNNQNAITWVVLTLVILTCGFIIAYFMKKRQLQPVRAKAIPDRQRLLAELAQLDDDFENDKINEAAYRKLRTERKSQLVKLMQKVKGKSGNE